MESDLFTVFNSKTAEESSRARQLIRFAENSLIELLLISLKAPPSRSTPKVQA